MNLFGRLLKYQENEKRSNNENYLTEILCDYLNRLSVEETKDFINMIMFNGQNENQFNEYLDKQAKQIKWETQHTINVGVDDSKSNKFPDLIGFIDNETPIVIIEVKINARFTQRINNDEEGNQTYIPQLNDYGLWLNNENPDAALVLLSHSTSAPEDFLEKNDHYGVSTKNYITWQNIFNWLKKQDKSKSRLCITNDFINYLEEQGMANESPTGKDIIKFSDFYTSGADKRIEALMENLKEKIKNKYTNDNNLNIKKSNFIKKAYTLDSEVNIISSWVDKIINKDESSYIAWGLAYSGGKNMDKWSELYPNFPEDPFIFIGLFSGKNETKNIFHDNKDKLKNWMWSNERLIDSNWDVIAMKTQNINEISSHGKDLTVESYDFIIQGFQELEQMINRVKIN